VPRAAGEYTVKATIAATESYNEKTLTTDFTIAKRIASLKWGNTSFKWTGEEQVPDCEIKNLASGDECEVTLEGGSGKASVTSPAKVTVKDGIVTAEIIWSSSNYDFMVVNEERFDPVNSDGNSTFEIPVTGFDYKMPVSADTTAMSTQHLIDYTLTFDSASLTPAA
jgi:hypothetical protein